jgi:uncharacterized protein YicC (UPF0701 family)
LATISKEEKQPISFAINKLKKQLKTMEKRLSAASVNLGEKLVIKVSEEIKKLKDHIDNIEEVLTCSIADYQADTVIAYCTINQLTI